MGGEVIEWEVGWDGGEWDGGGGNGIEEGGVGG